MKNAETVKPLILIVDDEDIILELLSELLTQNRYNVITAKTLAAAHEVMRNEIIDLILCDISLPDSKYTDLWALLRNELHRDIPVIFMTGHNHIPRSTRQVLMKPFSDRAILQAIRIELDPSLPPLPI